MSRVHFAFDKVEFHVACGLSKPLPQEKAFHLAKSKEWAQRAARYIK